MRFVLQVCVFVSLYIFYADIANSAVSDCAGTSPDGKAICVTPDYQPTVYHTCVETGFLYPENALHACAIKLGYANGFASEGAVSAAISCAFGGGGAINWLPTGQTHYDYNLCWTRTVTQVNGVEVRGWGHSVDSSWGVAVLRDTVPYCKEGFTAVYQNIAGVNELVACKSTCPTGQDRINGICQVPIPTATPIKYPEPERTGPQMCDAQAQSGLSTKAPIIPATGEKFYTHSDYTGDGPHALNLIRTFRSRWSVSGAPGFAGLPGLGQSWAHNYSDSLVVEGANTARFIQGNGSTSTFNWDATTATWKPATGPSTLVATTSPVAGYLLTRAEDDATLQFNASGKLLTLTERNGWTTSYSYNPSGQLAQVSNAFGRSITFSYNSAGQLISVTTPDGQTISYTFDSALRLIGVGYSGNVSKNYLYEDARWPQSVTGVVDERGIRLATVVYDAQGRAVQSGYALGADQYSVAYPASTDVATQVTDPLGTTRSYTYGTTQGKLAVTGATLPSGSGGSDAASRVQNASGLIDQETDFTGVQTLYTWDINRRLPLSTTQAAGRPEATTTSTQWHPVWRLPVQITELGRTTRYTYDAHGNTVNETVTDTTGGSSNGANRTWAWTYTAANLVDTQIDPLGQVWRFEYDSTGNRTSVQDPLGQTTRYTYDAAGRVVTQSEPGGLLSTYSYDLRGRLALQTAGNEANHFAYTPSGQLASVTLPNGYAISYQYDAAQRLVAASDNRGNTITYTLDAMGNRVHEDLKDPSGNIALTTSRVVSNLNRISAVAGSQGQSTQFGFDANGEPVAQTDPLNHTTRHTLDALRRPVAITLPDNAQANTAWSALGALASATDPKGVTTSYVRNAWGEVLQETSPDSGTTHYTRDAAGHISTQTDARGQTTTYVRDALGRPTTITLANGSSQTLGYDTQGNLTQLTDASGSTSYTHDALGRILQKTQTVADNPGNPTTTTTVYAYHPGGTLAQVTYPSGLKVYYRLGSGANVGRIVQVDVQQPGWNQPLQSFAVNLAYTALGQPKSWSWSNSDAAQRGFDADGRMTGNEFASYQYDAAGRITAITQALRTQGGSTSISWSAGYDTRDRLTSFARTSGGGASTRYTYDANSNRLTSIETTTSDTDLDGDFDQSDTTQTTSQALGIAATSNRLLGFTQTQTISRTNAKGQAVVASTSTQVNYSLDEAGNLTSDGLRQFGYDAANRLSQVQRGHAHPGPHDDASTVRYLHNALGQRVFKSEPQVAQAEPDADELGGDFVHWLQQSFGWLFAHNRQPTLLGQSYVYGDGPLGSYNLLGEYGNGGSKSSGRVEYLWLPTETGSAQLIGLSRNHHVYAVHTDHLGTPRLVTDERNQAVWQWSYSAFGDNPPTGLLKATRNPKQAVTNAPTLLKATAPMITMNLRFAGQYWDEESKLSYNYFRSYQGSQGRYAQADPIGLQGGFNPYSYVEGNPVSRTDPLGLEPRSGPYGPGPNTSTMPARVQTAKALDDFLRNYRNMRDANTIGGDKYFHCMANCEATRRGPWGEAAACTISDTREWADQNLKGDPASASAADQAANAVGRSGALSTPQACSAVCSGFRPPGLPARY